MGAYDSETGFRNGSLAQRNPKAYFIVFGAMYVVVWFGLGLVNHGHHRLSGSYVLAALVLAVAVGAISTALHYWTWRWRTARGRNASARMKLS